MLQQTLHTSTDIVRRKVTARFLLAMYMFLNTVELILSHCMAGKYI